MSDHPDADLVGFELLVAREFRDREVHFLRFVLALIRGGEHLLGDPAKQERGPLQLRPLRGVMGGDMRDFMRHDGGDFRLVVRKRQQAARHVNVSRRQARTR